MPPHFPISEGHSQLVKCLMRQLLRDARRIRDSKSPFLFLQARPQKEAYSHLWEINPDHDARILDALLPPYLRHELTTCELKAKEMERIIKQNFRRFRDLGVPGANASAATAATDNNSTSSSTSSRSSSSSDDEPSSSPSSRSSKRGSKKSTSAQNPAAGPLPTLDQVIDDTLTLARTMGEQIRLFESTSVTESYGIRVIATAIPATRAHQQQQLQQQQDQPGGGHPPPPPYFFFYNIRVENRNKRATVQLVGRHWIIQDEEGRETDRVPKGSVGVVGMEPILRPGNKISYMSGAKLPTAFGMMQGSFQMVRKSGEGGGMPDRFDAQVSPFLLK